MFGDHTYQSGITGSASEHFPSVSHGVNIRFLFDADSKSVLDIGSNDGERLKHFKALGYEVVGTEYSKCSANNAGIPTINDSLNLDLSGRLDQKCDVVNAAGVFYHLEELRSATEGVRDALHEAGVLS